MTTAADSLNNAASQLALVIAAYQQVTDAVQERLDALADWQIADPITVTIGVDYATIQEAWDAFKFKQLNADVIIQVPDGIHPINPLLMADAPFGSRIRILGNIANAAACTLQYTGGAADYIVSVERCALEFSGFTIDGDDPEAILTGLRIVGGFVTSQPGSIRVNGVASGISGQGGAWYSGGQPEITGCQIGIAAYDSARVECPEATIVGLGKTWLGSNGTARSYGLYSIRSGTVIAPKSTIDAAYFGMQAIRAGAMFVSGTALDDCDTAITADRAGNIYAGPATDGTPTTVTNVNSGFVASINGTIEAQSAVVDGAITGFVASGNGSIVAAGATAKNCSSYGYSAVRNGYIAAQDTNANNAGNAVNYNLANDTPGATGGLITYS
ncbi:hypothetical protein HDIA_2281 [Hartmannibacter diazotrophicus]|uniref:Uncharacterized protein n=1 Tax=Hartmannibacter diazotrophicus TaxID=1482074 RepID=A0A2C9D663_9HYPH|nr:hypothetical protein [Hartmannibacter diazotrophicus]SON55822.1 hypothetical protein HDIA_2281 [Hartmannibacter diazotrophicus]